LTSLYELAAVIKEISKKNYAKYQKILQKISKKSKKKSKNTKIQKCHIHLKRIANS